MSASESPEATTINPTPEHFIVPTPQPPAIPDDLEIFECQKEGYCDPPFKGPGYFYPESAHMAVWTQVYFLQVEYPKLTEHAIADSAGLGYTALVNYAAAAEMNAQIREAKAEQRTLNWTSIAVGTIIGASIMTVVYFALPAAGVD